MTNCIVCGGAYIPSRLPGLLRCASCGFTTANLELNPQQLAQLYDERYFRGEEYRDYPAERSVIETNFRHRLDVLLQYLPNHAAQNLFEIGSAYGFFLSLCRPHFAAVEGVDIAAQAVRFAVEQLQLPVARADFLDYSPKNRIDVACMWDTIEHLEKPHLCIEKLARWMPRSGVLALTTGDLDSLVARWRGSRWRQIHPPTHLQYFSRATLTRLLGKYGFRVLKCGYVGTCRTVDTMAYIILNKKNHLPGLYRILQRSSLLNWNLCLNLRDILYVIAAKEA